MASKVYFTDMRTRNDQCLQDKLLKLIRKAGFDSIDFNDHYAAIKLHFGELGNLAFLRPNTVSITSVLPAPIKPKKPSISPLFTSKLIL